MQTLINGSLQCLKICQLTHARITACQMAADWLNDLNAIMLHQLQIILGDGILKHSIIHCRCNQFRTLAGEKGCRQHIVCLTMNNFRNYIGRSRCDDEAVSFFRDADMLS